MAENIQRSQGLPPGYRYDRGGVPAQFGPFIGIVCSNVDATRSGRLKVYIEGFNEVKRSGAEVFNDPTLWTDVRYCPPFYGATPFSGTSAGVGGYAPGNRQSYGMWFTPPDIGVSVLCFFCQRRSKSGILSRRSTRARYQSYDTGHWCCKKLCSDKQHTKCYFC